MVYLYTRACDYKNAGIYEFLLRAKKPGGKPQVLVSANRPYKLLR
jgi:hypothetical protein